MQSRSEVLGVKASTHKLGGNAVQPTTPVLLFPWLSRVVCDVSKRKVPSLRILPEDPEGLGKFLEGMSLNNFEVCT